MIFLSLFFAVKKITQKVNFIEMKTTDDYILVGFWIC